MIIIVTTAEINEITAPNIENIINLLFSINAAAAIANAEVIILTIP